MTVDAGSYNEGTPGDAGSLGLFYTYKLDNPTGTKWKWFREVNQYKQHTFASSSMADVLIWANSEVDNKCDTAEVEFRLTKERTCDGCAYNDWDNPQNYAIGTENPCFHVNIISNTNFEIVHGAGAGETCQ